MGFSSYKVTNRTFFSSIFLLIPLVIVDYVFAQNSYTTEERSQQAGRLIIENTNLLREVVELLPNESNMNQAQPFPQELQETVNGAINRFISHSNNLLVLSEELSSTLGSADCRNMLANTGHPAMERIRADYIETRDLAPPSPDRNLQLANLWGYNLLLGTSFSPKAFDIQTTLTICSEFNMP